VVSDAVPGEVRATDGRTPGSRGRDTRQRLLAATRRLLAGRPYRELAVLDIAREAGTSPATFYQYFRDIESAVLALADELADAPAQFGDAVRQAPWRGRQGYPAAERLAGAFLDFWREHRPLLSVVDLATAEGDQRFRALRTRLLNDVTVALAEAVTAYRGEGGPPGPDALATGATLVSMLSHVSAHRDGLEAWGLATADLRTAMARIVYWSITGRRPPPA
jgi:AcrR family transcriptional regulator